MAALLPVLNPNATSTSSEPFGLKWSLSGIDTIAAANAFLPAFTDWYNERFAKVPLEDRDVPAAAPPS